MSQPDGIKRKQFDVDSEKSIRVYWSPNHDAPPMPSVSVIKGLREDPEKKEAIEGWEERYDGKSKWGRPWHEDQKAFKGYRGTLIHFAILSALEDASGDTYFHNVGKSDWGLEEYRAEYCLRKWSKKAPSANSDEVPYTPRDNKHDGEHAWDRAVRDMKWATRTFKKEIIDDGRLDPENVIGVESFVFDTEYGYGGQYDLLYETPDGRTILSDLKTSSGVRFDHKLQSAAYKRAVEAREDITIDECEIVRIYPDKEEVEVSRSPDWDRTLDGMAHQFLGLADKAWTVEYPDTLRRAEEELKKVEHEEGMQIEHDDVQQEATSA